MIWRIAIFALATAALSAAGADSVNAILDQARGVPAEIFADVAFRLIDGHRVAQKDQVALLDEVFRHADGATQPMAIRAAALFPLLPGLPDLHLDTLAIKCRVVQALLAIDGKRARERFASIAAPEAPKPDCRSAVVFDPTIYFETVAAVATKAPFTAEEHEKQAPFRMMEDAVRRIQTSLEIVAAARNFPQLVENEKEAIAMADDFAGALEIDDSDRNFGAAAVSSIADAVLQAGESFSRLGASPQTLPKALRAYLLRHLTAARCEDSDGMAYSRLVTHFQSHFFMQPAVPPLSIEEMWSERTEGKAERHLLADQDDYIELSNDFVTLDFNDTDTDAIQRVLAKLGDWQGSPGEDAVEAFHRKAGLYYNLLRRVPDFKKSILAGLIATMENATVLRASPSDWLTEIHELGRATDGWREIANALIDSRLPALAVYGSLAVALTETRPGEGRE